MIIWENTDMKSIILHQVGNKLQNEGVKLSKEPLSVNPVIRDLLLRYFIAPFKSEEYHNLSHDSDIELNEVYSFVSRIFNDPTTLYEHSISLARHLYERSNHPKIKRGEFYTVYFKGCKLNGESVDAVGLFKSENKDTFLKVYPSGQGFEIESQQGVNINKLDKGCIIFNTEKEKGYLVSVVDNTNKGADAQFWINDFLRISPRKDDYHDTQLILSLCNDFLTRELPEQVELSRAEQAGMLNESMRFFKERGNFNLDEFAQDVMGSPELIDRFNNYRKEFQEKNEIELQPEFNISEAAVKKEQKHFRSVIKLDHNFHIYIHGNHKYIRKGYDEESGLNYYQLFFKDEL